MQPLVIVQREIVTQIAHGFCHTLVIFEIDFFLFDAAPQPLHENSVQSAPSPIHTDADTSRG